MIPSGPRQDIIDKLKVNPFIDGPTEALVKALAGSIARVPEFSYIFGENVDVYERFDYSERQLPALRVYNHSYTKQQESHYIEGEVLIDIVWPPSIRRAEQQYFQDVLSAALLQQLRRPHTFRVLQGEVRGLNEMGKVLQVNKELGMQWDGGTVPITEMRANFRIDLKQWDQYLEDKGRTKDDPFNVTLAELKQIAFHIEAVRESPGETPPYKLGAVQPVGDECNGAD